jgi:hypothetical protein
MSAKDIAGIIRELERQSFTVTRTAKNHWIVRSADGRRVATLPSTPSDRRSLLNALAALRRAGFQWPPTGRR